LGCSVGGGVGGGEVGEVGDFLGVVFPAKDKDLVEFVLCAVVLCFGSGGCLGFPWFFSFCASPDLSKGEEIRDETG